VRAPSLASFLAQLALTGTEGALIGIALISVLKQTPLTLGIWGLAMAGLIFAQVQRLLKMIPLAVLVVLSAIALTVLPSLRAGQPILSILLLAVLVGLVVMGLGIFFRLLYNTLSQWF
jgi:hypothetical protein